MAQSILSLGIHGATGRMGTRLVQLIAGDPELELVAAIDRTGHPQLGEDAGSLAAVSPLGVPLSSSLPSDRKIDVMIDFSLPEGSLAIARLLCRARHPPRGRHHRFRRGPARPARSARRSDSDPHRSQHEHGPSIS